MKLIFLAFTLFLVCSLPLKAAWWAENDYTWGTQGYKKDSLSFFKTVSTRTIIGLNAGFFKDDNVYRDKVYTFRMPLIYSAKNYSCTFKPFYYTGNADIDSNAYGAKLYFLYPFGENSNSDSVESHTHLIFSASAANQNTRILKNGQLKKTKFTEASFEAQVEKNFFNSFFFLFSGAMFANFSDIKQSNLINPALDHSELSFMGTFAPVTQLPKWVVNMQFARNMDNEAASHLYFGFSRIRMESSPNAFSAITGMRAKINQKTSVDLAYNWLKFDNISARNYYKILFQIFF